jgi:hypothetical protein
MSRVVITIEDKPEGGVKCECTPNFETMMMKENSGNRLTSAEAYAVHVLNALRKASKEQASALKVLIPRLGR